MSSNQAVLDPTFIHFEQEASALLQQIGEELQTLNQNFSLQKAHTLMRLAHTLKGAAATVGLDVVKTVTQALENTFKALCTPDASLTPVVEQLIFEGYSCLELLLSPPLATAQSSESDILDRMSVIVAQLQDNLGDRYGQSSCLPSSAQLGVDVTQSIFESGVTDYLNELESALTIPNPDSLKQLLLSHADVFIGLSESLRLPGFGNIARATVAALKQHPDKVVFIAHMALRDYRAGQTKVLQGDRNQGGAPGETLVELSTHSNHWLKTIWQWLNQPISCPCWLQRQANATPNNGQTPIDLSLNQLFQQCHNDLEHLIKQQHKPVLVNMKGGDTLVEHTVTAQLHKPLTHLVYNAFNHNIEIPEVRQQRGKSSAGKIQLAARRTKRHLVMCVWDDGHGANPEPVRQQVQPQIKRLGGTITAAHHPGKGTCFTLKVPVHS